MYVLLLTLAVVDIICTTRILPKMLEILLASGQTISYEGCMTQLFFFTWFLGAEMALFTAMAYDRSAAVCFPLHYRAIMNHHVRVALLSIAMAIAKPPLLALSCSPVGINEVMVCVADITLAVGDFALTCISYSFIIAAIFRIRTAEGKRKAFSTCSAHLTVESLYYFSVIYTYIRPASSYAFERDKVVVALCTLVTLALNPIVYRQGFRKSLQF
ncbi:Olfactory Receptor 13G1 [Manis pentadactyla]|nr:Olfactory Receptor 13G1 [Manis pentadactyla]